MTINGQPYQKINSMNGCGIDETSARLSELAKYVHRFRHDKQNKEVSEALDDLVDSGDF